MDESLQAQIASNLSHLDGLIRRGRQLRETLAADPSDKSALVANRGWQQDCGVAINQLSGGSKAHWLARSFSEAFLMRSKSGQVIEAVAPAEIVERLVGVLDQAVISLSRMGDGRDASTSSPVAAPLPHRFDFVHTLELRPIVEQAYADSRDALEQGNYGVALINSCGILEAIVTDALEHKGLGALVAVAIPAGKIADWSFDDRLAVAEEAQLIRGGCARLPEISRRYREITDADGNPQLTVSERDALRTTQVLHVVMRDLDPGR
jgi:hypothetical protein